MAARFGGPIKRNRLFFFGNLERLKEQSEIAGRARRSRRTRSVTAC